MFFMMSITDGRKDFDFHQQIICDLCGRYGRFQVFMTYTVLAARGEDVEILPEHLRRVQNQYYGYTQKRCRNCGFSTTEDFEYCPKCGNRF